MTTLDIIRRPAKPHVLLEVRGDLDILTQGAFESAVMREVDRTSVILDVSKVDFVAISALKTLLFTNRYAALRGRCVAFAGPNPTVRRLLVLSRLDSVLVVCRSVADAHGELQSARCAAGRPAVQSGDAGVAPRSAARDRNGSSSGGGRTTPVWEPPD